MSAPSPSGPEEYFMDLTFPILGLSQLSSHANRAVQTTAEGINVRTTDSLLMRRRGGSRPGLSRWIDQQLPLEEALFGESDSTLSTLLMQGQGGGADQYLHTLFGFGTAGLPVDLSAIPALIQHLAVLVNPSGVAIYDPYIDNHRGFRRTRAPLRWDPFRLEPLHVLPLWLPPFEPWSD